jgi:hypothetical protein
LYELQQTPVKRQHSKIIKAAKDVSTDIQVTPKYIHFKIKQLSKEGQNSAYWNF